LSPKALFLLAATELAEYLAEPEIFEEFVLVHH
jgi:hypothetical protein